MYDSQFFLFHWELYFMQLLFKVVKHLFQTYSYSVIVPCSSKRNVCKYSFYLIVHEPFFQGIHTFRLKSLHVWNHEYISLTIHKVFYLHLLNELIVIFLTEYIEICPYHQRHPTNISKHLWKHLNTISHLLLEEA